MEETQIEESIDQRPQLKRINWRRLGFEFLSIFIAVTSAFALNNWSENRRDAVAGDKIMEEISNGLLKDIEDIRINMGGHEDGVLACKYWRDFVRGKEVDLAVFGIHYFNLTRDFISIQNISGYETLKSKGLELIEDDSLRFQIINVYEYDYSVLKKFEEEYKEMQYHESYFEGINNIVAPNLEYDSLGNIIGIRSPLEISAHEKSILLSYLWKMQANREFILRYYTLTEQKLTAVREQIEVALN